MTTPGTARADAPDSRCPQTAEGWSENWWRQVRPGRWRCELESDHEGAHEVSLRRWEWLEWDLVRDQSWRVYSARERGMRSFLPYRSGW